MMKSLLPLGYKDLASGIEDFAYAGRRLSDMAQRQFLTSVKNYIADEPGLKAILLSGGGNDVVSGFPGQQPLFKMLQPRSAGAPELNEAAVASFIDGTLADYYKKILNTLTASTRIPILIHGYDHPIPDGKGDTIMTIRIGPWIQPILAQRGYDFRPPGVADLPLARNVVRRLIDRFNAMIARVAAAYPNVHHVNLTGTLAQAYGNDYTTHWNNELHPERERIRPFGKAHRSQAEISQGLGDKGLFKAADCLFGMPGHVECPQPRRGLGHGSARRFGVALQTKKFSERGLVQGGFAFRAAQFRRSLGPPQPTPAQPESAPGRSCSRQRTTRRRFTEALVFAGPAQHMSGVPSRGGRVAHRHTGLDQPCVLHRNIELGSFAPPSIAPHRATAAGPRRPRLRPAGKSGRRAAGSQQQQAAHALRDTCALVGDAFRFLPAPLPDQRDSLPVTHGIAHRMRGFADQVHRFFKATAGSFELAPIGEHARLARKRVGRADSDAAARSAALSAWPRPRYSSRVTASSY